jgi:hypothetical protein
VHGMSNGDGAIRDNDRPLQRRWASQIVGRG